MHRIPLERQKLRSGFPPRELHPPSDPSQPVALVNGEKVSVDILPAPPTPSLTPPQGKEEAGYGARGELAGQVEAAGAEGVGLQQQAKQTQQGNRIPFTKGRSKIFISRTHTNVQF